MSPAKRLGRQRFRALCERCREWHSLCHANRITRRTDKFFVHLMRTIYSDSIDSFLDALHHVRKLARLAR